MVYEKVRNNFMCIMDWFYFYNLSQPATISGGVTGNIVNSIKEVVKVKGII